MKGLTVLLMFLLPLCSYSQGVFTNNAQTALQKVISDYPNRFKNIKGQPVNEDPQSTDFTSTVQIPGAQNAVITRYSSEKDEEIYSWKCILTASEDFETASAKYKELFKQISNSIIKVDGEKPFILNGVYESPTEEKDFVTSAFYLLPSAPGDLSKVKVELSLEYYITEWKLALLVYDREEENVVMD